MNPFQNPDILAIRRFKADVVILARDRIRFIEVGDNNNKYPYSAMLDPKIYHGNLDILEDAVRNKKQLWLIIEVRTVKTSPTSHGFSASGKEFYLSDAHYLNGADEAEDVNPSKR
jgi:hypothetical protein